MTTYSERPIVLPVALKGASNGRLPAFLLDVDTSHAPTVRLAFDAMRAWRAMRAAAAADGHTLTSTSYADSYRPYDVQEATFRQRYSVSPIVGSTSRTTWNGETWYLRPGQAPAAPPGRSNHGLGLAVDIADVDPLLPWLLANADRFGWSWELQAEPWHLHYYAGDAIPPAVLAYEKGPAVTGPDLQQTAIDAREGAEFRGDPEAKINTGHGTVTEHNAVAQGFADVRADIAALASLVALRQRADATATIRDDQIPALGDAIASALLARVGGQISAAAVAPPVAVLTPAAAAPAD